MVKQIGQPRQQSKGDDGQRNSRATSCSLQTKYQPASNQPGNQDQVVDNGGHDAVAQAGTAAYLNKYPNGAPYPDKAPVIRYPEEMLSLAEARFRTAGPAGPQVLALLNAVRVRSASAETAYLEFASDTEAVDAVLLECRIEFLGEGIRNIDVRRFNAPIPNKGTVSAVNPTDFLHVWPIPASEVGN